MDPVPKYQIDYSRLEIIKEIAKSQSCTVELAKLKEVDGSTKEVAAKTYNTNLKISEIKILSELDHKNVIKFIGAATKDDGRNILVMEYAPDGNLYNYLRKQNKRLSFDHSLEWAKQCSNAVAYLHKQNPVIVHRDIKSPNFLLSADFTEGHGSHNVLKLCDFGISHESKTSALSTTICTVGGLTHKWAAPEVIDDPNCCSVCSDVYSLAVVIWELFTKEIPYDGMRNREITNNKFDNKHLNTDGVRSESVGTMLKKCWSNEKIDRPMATYVIEELDKATNTDVDTDSASPRVPSLVEGLTSLAAALQLRDQQLDEQVVPFTPRSSQPQSPQRTVTDKELLELAKHLGKNWKNFARRLGFENAEIERWEIDHNTNVLEATFAMLYAWRCKFGSEATVGNLVKYLDKFMLIHEAQYQFLNDDSKKNELP